MPLQALSPGGNEPVPVIVNGSAGAERAHEALESLERKCRDCGLNARVLRVEGGDGLFAAADAAVQRGLPLVIAGGGDGTVSAVASRVAGSGTAMGVLPMGTLNHFAKDMGMPLDIDAAIAGIARGTDIEVDVGEVNGQTFLNNSSLGLYPEIVVDREWQRRRLGRGKWPALLAASLHALRRYPVLRVRIGVNGSQLERRSAFVFIGNNEYRMDGFNIGERTRLDTGELSLYVTQRTSRFGLVRLALRALLGRLQQASDFDMLKAGELEVRTSQRHLRVAIDGEVRMMESPLQYRIRPLALRVRVPPR